MSRSIKFDYSLIGVETPSSLMRMVIYIAMYFLLFGSLSAFLYLFLLILSFTELGDQN